MPPPVQDGPLMGKFKLKGKGEKYKVKAAKQFVALEPADLMNGEEVNIQLGTGVLHLNFLSLKCK